MKSLSKNVRLSDDVFHIELHDGDVNSKLEALSPQELGRLLKERQERAYQQGHRDGYSEGYGAGVNEGIESGRRQLEEKLAGRIDITGRLIQEAQELKNKVIREAEPQLVSLAVKIAEKILQVEVQNREVVRKLVKFAVEQTVDRTRVEVRVNPDDFDTVEQIREEIMTSVKRIGELAIIKDTTIGRGGCFISTASGNIDAQIDRQFEELKRTLNL